MSLARPFSSSIDAMSPDQPTNAMPGAISSAFEASSPGFGRPPAAAPALSRCFVVRSSSWSAAIRSSTASGVRAPTATAARSSAAKRSSISRSAVSPVTASIRRIPEPMLRSPVMTKVPIWPDARQWVPPHSSWLNPFTRIVRTLSPYFSSKNASAPAACASAIVIHSIDTGRSSRTTRRTSASIARFSCVGQRAVEREVEPEVVRVHERARLPGPVADDVAQRAVEQVRARVVAHRVGTSLGVDLGADDVPDADGAVEHAAMDGQPGGLRAGHALDVVDVEQDRAVRRRGSGPVSATWPPDSA